MTRSLRLLTLLGLIWACASVLSYDFEHDARAVIRLAPGMDLKASASVHGAPPPRLPSMLRAVNQPFESWAPAGSGVTADVSMRLITLGVRN